MARQPILTDDEKVFGYELLFRDGVENFFSNPDPDAASRSTLDSTLLMGLDTLCDGRRAFINCTREVLLREYITLLPPAQSVVEILESVPPDDAVFAACERLKKAGYLLALDDFRPHDPRERLVDLADILKIELTYTSVPERASMMARYLPHGCRIWPKR